MSETKKRRSYLSGILGNRCPRCREGKIFKSGNAYALKNHAYLEMHETCPVCGQPTEIEVGFYYGTGYVSYALTVAISVATFVAWWVLIGFSLNDNRIFWWLGINSVLLLALQPVLSRLSRSIWLSWFVKYDPQWKEHPITQPERLIKNDMKKI